MDKGCDEKGFMKEVEMEANYISLVRGSNIYLMFRSLLYVPEESSLSTL